MRRHEVVVHVDDVPRIDGSLVEPLRERQVEVDP
jgi:hypothetical protein